MNKSKIMLAIATVVLLVFIALATKFWFTYFLDLNSNGSLSLKGTSYGSLELKTVKLMDENQRYITSLDDVTSGYEFTVNNYKTSTTKYSLYLEDIPYYVVDDGCTNAMTLKRSELDYALYLNGELLVTDSLSSIKNNLLDSRSINIDVTNNYVLKIWINKDAQDTDNKHYHYRVNLVEDK